jgi:dynein heavy chain
MSRAFGEPKRFRDMETLFEMSKADALNPATAKTEAEDDAKKGKKDGDKGKEAIKVTHEDHRLWITTKVHPKFPIALLQLLLKLTNEPPAGAKASMK